MVGDTTSAVTVNFDTDSIVTALNSIKTAIEANTSALQEIKTTLVNVKDSINAHKTSESEKLSAIIENLICDKSYTLTTDESTGNRSAGYYLASIATLLKKSADENRMQTEESSESDTNPSSTSQPSEEEINEVDAAIEESTNSVLSTFVSFKYGVESQTRLKFQSEQDFVGNSEGQSFDFTRYFVNHWNTEKTKATEFVLLGASRTSNISTLAGTDGLSRVTAWKDVKKVQTVVIVENTVSKSCKMYFPTVDSVTEMEKETFAEEKKAVDSAVAKFQEMLGDSYASVVVIPAKTIEQDILQSEYVEKAKLITPTYEYN